MALWYFVPVNPLEFTEFSVNANPTSDTETPVKNVKYEQLTDGSQRRITAPTLIDYGSIQIELKHLTLACKNLLYFLMYSDFKFYIRFGSGASPKMKSIKDYNTDGKWQIDNITGVQKEPKKFYIKGTATVQQGWTMSVNIKEVI